MSTATLVERSSRIRQRPSPRFILGFLECFGHRVHVVTIAQILQTISVAVGIASLGWAILVALRKGDISRQTLQIILGFTGASSNIIGQGESKTRRIDRTTLIFAAPLQPDETAFFTLFLAVQNTGTTAVKNLRVSLDYPAEHYLRDLSLLQHFQFADHRQIKTANSDDRYGSVLGGTAKVVHEFALVRPGEGVILMEPTVWNVSSRDDADLDEPMEILPLEERLSRVGVAGSFPLDVFVAAENRLPSSRRFNVLWLNQDISSKEIDIGSLVTRIAEGFWGRMPKPGTYFTRPWPFRRSLVSWEGAEILRLDRMAATYAGKKYQVAEIDPAGYALAKIPMPTWNYHDDPRPNIEALRSPLLTKLRRWRRL